jgi:hypothetical protein
MEVGSARLNDKRKKAYGGLRHKIIPLSFGKKKAGQRKPVPAALGKDAGKQINKILAIWVKPRSVKNLFSRNQTKGFIT